MKVNEDYLIHVKVIEDDLIHMGVIEDDLIHMGVIEDDLIHMGVIDDYLIHRCKKLGMKGKEKGGKKGQEKERLGEREFGERSKDVVECKTGSQCPTGQDRILFVFVWEVGRCINFPTTHSVSCPSIYHLGTLLSLSLSLSLNFVLWHSSSEGNQTHPHKINHQITQSYLHQIPSHFFLLYPTIINLTTQQQPKEREKNKPLNSKTKSSKRVSAAQQVCCFVFLGVFCLEKSCS
jgi:hypothetical protein